MDKTETKEDKASNDKTAEEIHDRYCAGVPYQLGLREASINAMKAYSAQQLKEYKDKLKKGIRLEMENKGAAVQYFAKNTVLKLIDQTDTK